MATSSTVRPWERLLYPELKRFDPEGQHRALREARDARFDWLELLGIAFALVVTVIATRYSAVGFGLADRFGATMLNFVIAIPVLLVLGGPFYIRRTRRALSAQWQALQRTPSRQQASGH